MPYSLSHPVVTQRYAHLSTKSLQEPANTASAAIPGATRDAEATDGAPAEGAPPAPCEG